MACLQTRRGATLHLWAPKAGSPHTAALAEEVPRVFHQLYTVHYGAYTDRTPDTRTPPLYKTTWGHK